MARAPELIRPKLWEFEHRCLWKARKTSAAGCSSEPGVPEHLCGGPGVLLGVTRTAVGRPRL